MAHEQEAADMSGLRKLQKTGTMPALPSILTSPSMVSYFSTAVKKEKPSHNITSYSQQRANKEQAFQPLTYKLHQS